MPFAFAQIFLLEPLSQRCASRVIHMWSLRSCTTVSNVCTTVCTVDSTTHTLSVGMGF